jgi:cell division protein FtsI (penicillin-binding protein 3)
MARAQTKDNDLEEGTPDHPGEPLETAELDNDASVAAKPNAGVPPTPAIAVGEGKVVQAALRQSEPVQAVSSGGLGQGQTPEPKVPIAAETKGTSPTNLPTSGTVVLDVEQGGIEVPSLVGKTVRGALEAAQDAGLQLEAVGSGVARQQTPLPGTHVATGAHVTVQFGR